MFAKQYHKNMFNYTKTNKYETKPETFVKNYAVQIKSETCLIIKR